MAVPDPPGEVSLRVGEERHLPLGGLGTAGYIWREELTGPPGIAEIGWTTGDQPTAPGASGDEVLVVRGVTPGRTSVRLAQARPWETGTPPLREHSLSITVEG